jgi:hypothetical protein
MARRGIWAGLIVLAAAGLPGSASAKCERSGYTADPAKGTTSQVQMTASSGMDCVLRLALPKRYTLMKRRLVEKPVNGIATIEGETLFYRSVPGFKGDDRFVAEIDGKAFDGQGTARIVVDVTVE